MSGATAPSAPIREGFKPRDVEEVIDYYYHRPLAGLLVKVLARLPVSPDQVTYASGAVGLAAGLVMLIAIWGSPWWMTVGGFLLLASILLDCADGQLARIQQRYSVVGRILDGVVDIVAPASVFHGLAFYLLLVVASPPLETWWARMLVIWPLGLGAAVSLAWHSAQYDGMKNIYLHCSRPDFKLGGATLLTLEDLEGFKKTYQEKGDKWRVFLMNMWLGWTKSHEKTIKPWLGEMAPRTPPERQLFRQVFRRYMRAWTWLGFGTHLFLLTVAAWLAPLSPWFIWLPWGIILVPMNLWCVLLLWFRARLEQRYAERLEALRAAPPQPSRGR